MTVPENERRRRGGVRERKRSVVAARGSGCLTLKNDK